MNKTNTIINKTLIYNEDDDGHHQYNQYTIINMLGKKNISSSSTISI